MALPSPSVPEPRQTALDGALRLTAAMTEAAEAGDWDRLVELEAERRPLIEGAFEQVAPEDAAALGQAILDLMEADRHIMALARAGRTALASRLEDFSRGRRGRAAYGEVQALAAP